MRSLLGGYYLYHSVRWLPKIKKSMGGVGGGGKIYRVTMSSKHSGRRILNREKEREKGGFGKCQAKWSPQFFDKIYSILSKRR